MEHPKAKGDRTTLAVSLALMHAGYAISSPFGENTRYDLLIEDGRVIQRVQCKTGRLRKGAVYFATCSVYGHHRQPRAVRRDYSGEVDLFGVYCLETGGVYLVPIDEVGGNGGVLRIRPARNAQRRGVRYARDYELARIVIKPGAATNHLALRQEAPATAAYRRGAVSIIA